MTKARGYDELTLLDEHRLKGRKFDAAAFERARARLERRQAAVPSSIGYPDELPISACRDELRAAIRDNQAVIVAGETGSGKSTQLPKLCLELGTGRTWGDRAYAAAAAGGADDRRANRGRAGCLVGCGGRVCGAFQRSLERAHAAPSND